MSVHNEGLRLTTDLPSPSPALSSGERIVNSLTSTAYKTRVTPPTASLPKVPPARCFPSTHAIAHRFCVLNTTPSVKVATVRVQAIGALRFLQMQLTEEEIAEGGNDEVTERIMRMMMSDSSPDVRQAALDAVFKTPDMLDQASEQRVVRFGG